MLPRILIQLAQICSVKVSYGWNGQHCVSSFSVEFSNIVLSSGILWCLAQMPNINFDEAFLPKLLQPLSLLYSM